MSDLFRVFPFLPSAALAWPGGGLYVPPQGGGRLDNPDVYSVLYMSDSAAGAIAEAFGRFPEWTPAMLVGSAGLAGSFRAVARYRLHDTARPSDMDDPRRLIDLSLRPSEVVSRDYSRTREWALRVHAEQAWAGVRWWSYYDPRWFNIGLWDRSGLLLEEVRPIRLDDEETREAARVISRKILKNTNDRPGK